MLPLAHERPADTESPLSAMLQALYSPVASALAETEQVLQEEMRSRYPCVDELARYGAMLGGKRLRPALLLLSGKAVGELNRDHVVLAAVVEMIHTATLVHDDVLDDSAVRRHLATVNARWGTEASVLLGDYLFTHAFYLSSTLRSTFACRTIGKATNLVCEGELRQVHTRGNFSLTEHEYLSIIEAKTAELCACCCLLGAHASGASAEVVERLSRFGRNLGVAFQIADDLLDVAGDERTAGKSLGTDLEKQKPTLPLIHALERATPADREALLALLSSDEPNRRQALLPWLEKYEALQYARQRALAYSEAARRELEAIPDSASRDVLWSMAEFAVSRPA